MNNRNLLDDNIQHYGVYHEKYLNSNLRQQYLSVDFINEVPIMIKSSDSIDVLDVNKPWMH